jgi:hypothetical protein
LEFQACPAVVLYNAMPLALVLGFVVYVIFYSSGQTHVHSPNRDDFRRKPPELAIPLFQMNLTLLRCCCF